MHKLMIVDDSNIIRNKIKRSYDSHQLELVATASSGVEAVRLYSRHRPNVITMDLTMPGMDGIDCIERIMGMDSEVRILVVSALSDKATGIEALQKGARGFLLKPFTEAQLDEALNELMEEEDE
jgi:two-component system, chemotaxis family, chemotaxis protein CheY